LGKKEDDQGRLVEIVSTNTGVHTLRKRRWRVLRALNGDHYEFAKGMETRETGWRITQDDESTGERVTFLKKGAVRMKARVEHLGHKANKGL